MLYSSGSLTLASRKSPLHKPWRSYELKFLKILALTPPQKEDGQNLKLSTETKSLGVFISNIRIIRAMPPASFVIKQEQFEGPLDVLLGLIEKRKLLINEISLAKIADDYIEHIKKLEQFPIADSAHFILIASTLLLIKSKSLLPGLALTEEESGSIEDLETRLKIYKRMKDLSVGVKSQFGKEIMFPVNPRPQAPLFSPHESITVTNLYASVKELLKHLPKPEKLAKAVVEKVMSLEEMIGNLATRVTSSLQMSFKEFNRDAKTKVHIIVSFLAMLELVKQGIIHVTQEKHTDDIVMETKTISTPSYGA
jgi:segregation and condensation protein A